MNRRELVQKKNKLCYIDGNFAYFTLDFENQWGDDWNDTPYEHNAGEPYERDGVEIIKLAFDCYVLDTPASLAGSNSSYSVEDINSGKTPWLTGKHWELGVINIYAGATIEEFIEKVKMMDGEVFAKVE